MVWCVAFLLNPYYGLSQKKPAASSNTDKPVKLKKYPSLLWEITGNGLKQPSYLFGTMHISNKMVFNLSDSFYKAIKSVEVVALEQNPEVWQEVYSSPGFDDGYGMQGNMLNRFDLSNERLTEQTFSISNYEARIQAGLVSEARLINGMLYRNNVGQEDFEEETYLDMYIYRLGRKLNKIVAGVENYKESDKLVKEAYRDMYKDKKVRRSYNYDGYDYKRKMEEAYRKGDLDLLDSLNEVTTISKAFNEKFLLKRNDIQAYSIDTILKKHSLFVGVGAAHLAGNRGVIEILRQKGYRLRPVMIGQRDSDEKDNLEKIRVPLEFKKQYAEDSLYSVTIPGDKFFRFNSFAQANMVQYADMANGSYYMVTRIKTEASLLGQSAAVVLKKIDSLLYENIPGKITARKAIVRDGYSGYDITNKTRKGDYQRYNIFALPNEVVIFKVSGIADYITGGKEADVFFSSVHFETPGSSLPTVYKPPYGGFSALFPSRPFYIPEQRNDRERSEWLSSDAKGNDFFIFKTSINQFDYIEEDTFELRLMEESFKSSAVVRESPGGKTASWRNYPVLNGSYAHVDGSRIKVRYIIQGANYYVVGARYNNAEAAADSFINSFTFTPEYYGDVKEYKDSVIGFTVKSPLFYPTKDSSDNFSLADIYATTGADNDDDISGSFMDAFRDMNFRVIGNDTTGEKINLIAFRFPKYTYLKDSADFLKNKIFISTKDSDFIIRQHTLFTSPAGWRTEVYRFSDKGSSRVLTTKSFYKGGVVFYLLNMADTITPPGAFVQNFFETFTPADTFKTVNIFEKKSGIFFQDYFGKDSVLKKKAVRALSPSLFDAADLDNVKKAISELSWKTKNYLALKKKWINVVSTFRDEASVTYLKELYSVVKDTSELQNAVLDALLNARTQTSFSAFKDIMLSDPPALTDNRKGNNDYDNIDINALVSSFSKDENLLNKPYFFGYKWAPLYDTLAITKNILPPLLDLLTLDDYKDDILRLLSYAVDSGYTAANDYSQYMNKFLLEAKQLVKKQAARESEKEIKTLQTEDADTYADRYTYGSNSVNDELKHYAVLLMPFWNNSPDVKVFFDKVLQLKNKDAKLQAAILLLRNNKPVPDSIINMLAADDHYRVHFYNLLLLNNLTGKFPAAYKTQRSMAAGILYDTYSYQKVDSLVYIDKLQVADARNKGWLYFFRYRINKDDEVWHIACSGLQPPDTSQVSTTSAAYKEDFTGFTNEVYDEAVISKQMQRMLKENLYAQRESSSRFFSRYDDEDVDAAIVDEIKGGRFE